MVRRTGHSLPELLVAVVFLGIALAAVGGAAWLGAAWTDAAITRQAGVRLAVTVLDSLAGASAFQAGTATHGPLTVTWDADDDGLVRVAVHTAADTSIVELVGPRRPPVPTLPDAQ